MRSKAILVLLALLTIVSITYAYLQRKEAEFQRNQSMEMHREVMKLRQESEAARGEAAKLRGIIEAEHKKTEAIMQQLQSNIRK
jgi:hypothetical protein